MGVIRYTDPQAFAAAAAPMAARSDNVATMVAGWVHWLTARATVAEERFYLATFGEPDVTGIAMRRHDYAVRVEGSDDAAVAFARDIATDWPLLAGVVALRETCDAFAREWKTLTGRGSSLRFHLRNHQLTEVSPITPSPGRMRGGTSADSDWLIASHAAFIVESNIPEDPAHAAERTQKILERGEVHIWDDGGPVAFAGWSAPPSGIARIGPVWSSPPARRRGYATSLCAALARELLDKGCNRVELTTDLANTTSNAIYARVGFRPRYDFCHFDFVDR